MQLGRQQSGFTLFEMLVYIVLFSVIMSAVLTGVFYILTSSFNTRERVVLEQEAHFVFRKIDWALGGEVFNVSEPTPEQLFIDGIGNYTFELDDGVITLNGDPLTSSAIKATNFTVDILGGTPEGVSVSFELNEQSFASVVRYVRE